jgi:MFS family permease
MSSAAISSEVSLRYQRPFWWYWSARMLSVLGAQTQVVAVGWQMYDLTHDPAALGLAGLLQFLPAALFILPAGHAADHYNRRTVLYVCQAAYCIVAGLLLAGSLGGWMTPALLYAVAFLFGTVRTFEFPCASAMLPGLVTSAQLSRAISLSSSGRQAGLIAGPAIGGFAYASGASGAYAVAMTLFLLAGVATWVTRYKPALQTARNVDWKTVVGGITHIWRHKVLLGIISLDLFAVLLGGATALLPIFARDILGTSPVGLGFLRAAPGAGALVMSVWLVRYPIERRAGKLMFGAVAVFGLATLVFALSEMLWLSLLALFVLGASDMVSVVIRDSLVQLETPDEVRGRVNSVNWLFIGASNQLGEFESGMTAAWWGAVPSAVVGGMGSLLVTALWIRLFPMIWHRDKLVNPPAR